MRAAKQKRPTSVVSETISRQPAWPRMTVGSATERVTRKIARAVNPWTTLSYERICPPTSAGWDKDGDGTPKRLDDIGVCPLFL